VLLFRARLSLSVARTVDYSVNPQICTFSSAANSDAVDGNGPTWLSSMIALRLERTKYKDD
jgi:hypothetical protein